MISIEKAIELLKRSNLLDAVYTTTEHDEALQLAITALEAQQADMWIPVKDRLPEDRGYPPVICYNKEDDWTDSAIVTNKGRFINCEGIIIRPTHWKPLPESWKEEQ